MYNLHVFGSTDENASPDRLVLWMRSGYKAFAANLQAAYCFRGSLETLFARIRKRHRNRWSCCLVFVPHRSGCASVMMNVALLVPVLTFAKVCRLRASPAGAFVLSTAGFLSPRLFSLLGR
jgi:hypothetical protein